ncbi:hypothetical protein QBC39DRAFT_358217 [Podospora conica]|nr:hypothetical protein QBC39DRAFT_358217 [Schizothecium conicum]
MTMNGSWLTTSMSTTRRRRTGRRATEAWRDAGPPPRLTRRLWATDQPGVRWEFDEAMCGLWAGTCAFLGGGWSELVIVCFCLGCGRTRGIWSIWGVGSLCFCHGCGHSGVVSLSM